MVPIAAMFPLMTLSHFGGEAFEMGLVEAMWGIGMLIGGIIVSIKYMKTVNKVKVINIMTIILGVTYWLSGLLPTSGFIIFVILTTLGGIVGSIYWSSFIVILQTKIDPSALGRVFSIYDSISLFPTIPGLLATGFIAERIGILNAFIIAGGATFVVGIIAFFIPAITQLGYTTKGSTQKEAE